MKVSIFLPLAMVTVSLLLGCSASKQAKRYTVFPTTHTITNQAPEKPITSPYCGIRVRMANDLRAYNTPLFFHADGTVTPYHSVTYYAPLEVALERALADTTHFTASTQGKLKLEVRDYCVIEQPTTEADSRTWVIRVTLRHYQAGLPKEVTHSVTLPFNADAGTVRNAFATALQTCYQQILAH